MTTYTDDDFRPTIENVRQKDTQNAIRQGVSFDDIERMEGMEGWLPKFPVVSNWGYFNPLNATVKPPILGQHMSNPVMKNNQIYTNPPLTSLEDIEGGLTRGSGIYWRKDAQGNVYANDFGGEGMKEYIPTRPDQYVKILNPDGSVKSGSTFMNFPPKISNFDDYNTWKTANKLLGEDVSFKNPITLEDAKFNLKHMPANMMSGGGKLGLTPTSSYEDKVAARYKVMNDPRWNDIDRNYILNKFGLNDLKPPEVKEVNGVLYERQPNNSWIAKTPPVAHKGKDREEEIRAAALKIYEIGKDSRPPTTWEDAVKKAQRNVMQPISSVADDIQSGKESSIPTLDFNDEFNKQSKSSYMNNYGGR